MILVAGVVASEDGHAAQTLLVRSNDAGRNFDVKQATHVLPASKYVDAQANVIPVTVEHHEEIGRVLYLERDRHGRIVALSEIDAASLDPGTYYYSPEVAYTEQNGTASDIRIRSVAVTRKPAQVGLPPLDVFPATLERAARTAVYQDGAIRDLIQRAREYDRQRRDRGPLVIHDLEPYGPPPLLTRDGLPVDGWRRSYHVGRVIAVR